MAVVKAYYYYGAHIENMSVSYQWGGGGGSAQLTVVEDGIKGAVLSGNPGIGDFASVSIGSLTVNGILKRQTYDQTTGGRRFNIVIEAPTEYLDGIQVITQDFNGKTFPSIGAGLAPLSNTYNTYQYRLSQGGFVGTDINSSGAPAQQVLDDVATLASSSSSQGSSGKVSYGGYLWQLNLSNIYSICPSDFRISGPVQSLSSIISDICEVAGYDWWVDMSSTHIIPKVVSRSDPANGGAVSDYIANVLANGGGEVQSAQNGVEQSIPVTHRTIVGAPVRRMLIKDVTTYGTPFFGKTANNKYILAPIGATTAGIAIDEFGGAVDYMASEMEIRMAMGGRETWETFKALEYIAGGAGDGATLLSTTLGKIDGKSAALLNSLGTGFYFPIDLEPTNLTSYQKFLNNNNDAYNSRVYAAVSRVANDFYCQAYLINLSDNYGEFGSQINTNVRFVSQDVNLEQTWDIVDSAWVASNPFPDPSFYDESGRLKSGCAWRHLDAGDYSALGGDWCVTPDRGIASVKSSVENEVLWITTSDGTYPYAVCRTNALVLYADEYTTADYGLTKVWSYLTGQFIPPEAYLRGGGENLHFSVPPRGLAPASFGIAQESNTYRYGPWQAWSGTAGKAQVDFDDGFAPEAFGNLDTLDDAAFATAGDGVASAALQETGSVTILEEPQAKIGDKFMGGPYLTGIDVSVGLDGVKTTYKFNTWTQEKGKMAKFDIDRIQAIRKGSIASAQKRRSLIKRKPLPALKFQKSDFSHLSSKTSSQTNVNMIHSIINEF